MYLHIMYFYFILLFYAPCDLSSTVCSVSTGMIASAVILHLSKFTAGFASKPLVETRSKAEIAIGHV